MNLRLRHIGFALLTTLTTLGAVPNDARAGDEEAARLEARGKALRYTQKTTDPENSIDTGGAAIEATNCSGSA